MLPTSFFKNAYDNTCRFFTAPAQGSTTPQGLVDYSTATSQSTLPFSGVNPTQATTLECAAGFENMSNNCWINACLQMILLEPNLLQAYKTVANYHAQHGHKSDGVLLQNALIAYDNALCNQKPVPQHVSQEVRLAFHNLFGYTNSAGREIFSANCHSQEDAHEALQMLLNENERILCLESGNHPTFSSLYCPMVTIRKYIPIGEQRDRDPKKKDYSQLDLDNSSKVEANGCQLTIDLNHASDLSDKTLVSKHFNNTAVEGCDPAQYLLPNKRVQTFKLIGESRQYTRVPLELMLTLSRFIKDDYDNSMKNLAPVKMHRTLYLPSEATPENRLIPYELTSFIVHCGGIDGGHYICYKKIGEQWIEANDKHVRPVLQDEIDAILQGQKGAEFTSYVHHYVLAQPKIRNPEYPNPAEPALPFTPFSSSCLKDTSLSPIHFSTSCLNEPMISSTEAPDSCLNKLLNTTLEVFRHAIWLHDQTPNVPNYGTCMLHLNPNQLQQIHLPWLIGPQGLSLWEQMIHIQKIKKGIALELEKEQVLVSFLKKIGVLSNERLQADFQELPQQIQWDLQGLVYEAHKLKFGEAHVHNRKFKHKYGEVILSQKDLDLGRTLLDAVAPAPAPSGENIILQLAKKYHIEAEKIRLSYEKKQLQAFWELLQNKGLTNNQLVEAFERFEIRKELKEKIYFAIWSNDKTRDGKEAFKANPRCLLTITKPLLSEKGFDLLQQLIATLE